jgi:hypothetical protein
VLGRQAFDVARFVGKENVIYEMVLDSDSGQGLGTRLTLEISVTKHGLASAEVGLNNMQLMD